MMKNIPGGTPALVVCIMMSLIAPNVCLMASHPFICKSHPPLILVCRTVLAIRLSWSGDMIPAFDLACTMNFPNGNYVKCDMFSAWNEGDLRDRRCFRFCGAFAEMSWPARDPGPPLSTEVTGSRQRDKWNSEERALPSQLPSIPYFSLTSPSLLQPPPGPNGSDSEDPGLVISGRIGDAGGGREAVSGLWCSHTEHQSGASEIASWQGGGSKAGESESKQSPARDMGMPLLVGSPTRATTPSYPISLLQRPSYGRSGLVSFLAARSSPKLVWHDLLPNDSRTIQHTTMLEYSENHAAVGTNVNRRPSLALMAGATDTTGGTGGNSSVLSVPQYFTDLLQWRLSTSSTSSYVVVLIDHIMANT
ncbi:hypothetical protein LXA43DRAFT_1067998 [Ganoderma leucocontextum]|nr:hypothetical protein LXA43DRAFT_1067998 [Ganoderma leucocontextum]